MVYTIIQILTFRSYSEKHMKLVSNMGNLIIMLSRFIVNWEWRLLVLTLWYQSRRCGVCQPAVPYLNVDEDEEEEQNREPVFTDPEHI